MPEIGISIRGKYIFLIMLACEIIDEEAQFTDDENAFQKINPDKTKTGYSINPAVILNLVPKIKTIIDISAIG